MKANKRKEIGWILLWVLGTVFLFGSAGCKKKSAQTGQSGFPTSTTGQTIFTSPDDAATKTFGSLSVASDNIITARASQSEMITGRMITGRMITGRVITARIITGRIITARSPKFINVIWNDNDDDEDDILNLFGRLKKGRLSKKQSEEFEISCEDLKPKCVEGKVEKADCNQSANRINFDIKLSECKEIVDEQEGDYIVSTGYVKGYLEISTKVSQGSSDAKFIVAIEDGDSLVKEFSGNKETKRVRAKASKFRTEITGRFIEGEKDLGFGIVTKLSGSYSREDEIGNRKEAYSYNDYVVELTGKSPKSGGEATLHMSIVGGYSVDTTPDVECVEGVFNFKTIKPIKSSGQGYCGIESGEIEVNNAKMEFSSGKVKVSVENQQKEYGCEELGGLCKYEPITIAEGVEQKPCPVWFKDADGDGYTDGVTKVSCEQPAGYVSQAQTGDCSDDDKNINPNTVWFKDKDKDGYTDGTTKVSCEKELKRFDPILKEIFSKAAGKLISIATGEKINQELEDLTSEIEFVKSLRPDMVFRAGEKIFHIEIQVQPDKDLPERMLLYSLAIKEKFGQKPVQIILFVGKGNPPPPFFKDEFTIHKFIVLDMKKIDPDEFIKSKKPEEVIVGILAGKFKEKPQIIERVKERIVEIVKNEEEIAKYIDSISFLAGLFDIEIKVKPMPIQVDIRKTFLYKWGEKEGEKRGIEKGKQEGLKEAILLGVQIKFGKSKVKEVKTLLEKVDDLNHLKKIKRKIIEAKTWDDFVKVFRNHK